MISTWLPFNSSRVEMLNAFDEAKARAETHEVKVFHGNVAEATFRKWLIDFLPNKFGVTSGYIISNNQINQGVTQKGKLPHFDVIIYDRIESPILWIDDNPDLSSQGKSKAILSDHVRAVIEVKACLTRKSSQKAINQIARINNLYNIKNPRHGLPKSFFSMIVFFEIKQEGNKKSTLATLIPCENCSFVGGYILRTTEKSSEISVSISGPLEAKDEINDPTWIERKPICNDYEVGLSDGKKIKNKWHYIACKSSTNEFSLFAFGLLARLNGTYSDKTLSSYIGLDNIRGMF